MTPPSTAKQRKVLLLEQPDVAAWVKDRSPGSASVQVDHLRVFLERTGLDVPGLIRLAKKDERKLRSTVLDFIRERQEAGLTSKYVANIWWSIRSFLGSVNAAPEWNPSVKPTEADEEDVARIVPIHEQVRRIANAVKSSRDRMVVLVLASSGVRIGTFGTQNGHADGLRLKNLIDLKLDPEPHFERSPPILRVPAHLSKSSMGYYTGITDEAAEAVVTYLKERRGRGEKLGPDSPLVVPDARGVRESRKSKDGYEFVMRKSLASRVQMAIDVEFPGENRPTPHALRAFVSTQLESAEARGAVSKTRREFFLGHKLNSIDSTYNLSRPLAPGKIEELRSDFRNVLPFLELNQANRKQVDLKAEVRNEMARLFEKYVALSPSGTLTGEDLLRIIKESDGNSASASGVPPAQWAEVAPPKQVHEQRPVAASEVARYVLSGWRSLYPIAPDHSKFLVEWTGPISV